MAKILVVDDDETILEFLVACLKSQKHEVQSADNGRKGCNKAKEFRPDLLIVDLMMPDMHGFDVVQEVRAEEALKGMKVLVSSGKVYDVDRKAALRLGADGFLLKPYTADKLFTKVTELLG